MMMMDDGCWMMDDCDDDDDGDDDGWWMVDGGWWMMMDDDGWWWVMMDDGWWMRTMLMMLMMMMLVSFLVQVLNDSGLLQSWYLSEEWNTPKTLRRWNSGLHWWWRAAMAKKGRTAASAPFYGIIGTKYWMFWFPTWPNLVPNLLTHGQLVSWWSCAVGTACGRAVEVCLHSCALWHWRGLRWTDQGNVFAVFSSVVNPMPYTIPKITIKRWCNGLPTLVVVLHEIMNPLTFRDFGAGADQSLCLLGRRCSVDDRSVPWQRGRAGRMPERWTMCWNTGGWSFIDKLLVCWILLTMLTV